MNTNWNRRKFIKNTGTGTLIALATGLPSFGFASASTASMEDGSAAPANDLLKNFQNPPESALPWVFWYWMSASVSREGITADVEAMKQAGIGGAYLMPISGKTNPPLLDPPVEQLTPEWWGMIKHACAEAGRVGIKIAMNACDGWATAGGPWITPELSMQKVVWTETYIQGGKNFNGSLPQPETNANYYKDLAILAFPTPEGADLSTRTIVPKVTTSKPGEDAQFLVAQNNAKDFVSEDPCWIQYAFDQPFTCRSITVYSEKGKYNAQNYQSKRLLIEVSDDGTTFRSLGRLESPRHGWEDWDAPVTHSIIPATAKYFRFIYDTAGSEPGAEDLDSAKWKPKLQMRGLELSGAPRLQHFEGKNGSAWRIGSRTRSQQVPGNLCVPKDKIVDLTSKLDTNGNLSWNTPGGNWTILRIGHTSTAFKNNGGKGSGLECDKFNKEAIKLQFDKWFGEAMRQVGPDLAPSVLKVFHVDSWECGSQNWSPVFREEFKKRRGYDLFPYLPVMAGIPVQDIDFSERFLQDVRQTISDLVVHNFYKTLNELVRAKGCIFSSECVAPTMMGDGLAHFDLVDIPMGEFWLRSPTNDKLNDMLDAVSGAHIYGKHIIQSEAFTEVKMSWDEHPAMLKALGDRNFAIGVNKFVYHVFAHNPWLDRKPGMNLSGIGLGFQRDQVWWKPGREWVAYAQRCQSLLQQGRPVVDIAVFIGEETPRRAVLPERLVSTLPGIFGAEILAREEKRLANIGEPMRELPDKVFNSANTSDPELWIDPLHGYAYDSVNPDALLRLAKVRDGRIEFPGGISYGLLVLPGANKMMPEGNVMSPGVAIKLRELVEAGATILLTERPEKAPGLPKGSSAEATVKQVGELLWGGQTTGSKNNTVGKGRVLKGAYHGDSFDNIGLQRDLVARDTSGKRAEEIAWIHRTAPGFDIYFISNQQDKLRTLQVSLRVNGRVPEFWDAVTGNIYTAQDWRIENGRTLLPIRLERNGSVFVVLQRSTKETKSSRGKNWTEAKTIQTLQKPWQVTFDPSFGGPEKPVTFHQLTDWSKNADPGIQYYSGTAAYVTTFDWQKPAGKASKVWLNVGKVANIAEIIVNGINCGVAWTAPFAVDITKALRVGKNEVVIEASNTWANRMIGDRKLPADKRITRTNAPFVLEGKPLLEAGLLGPVTIQVTDR